MYLLTLYFESKNSGEYGVWAEEDGYFEAANKLIFAQLSH